MQLAAIVRSMPDGTADPSSFYRLNEEVAAELARLELAGALDRLQELLRAAGSELWISAARPDQGLEELLGVLRPRRAPPRAELTAPAGEAEDPGEGCGCAQPASPAWVELLREEEQDPRGGWDSQGYLAARSRFRVELPDGSAREVYMPDHVCPSCLHEEGNALAGCARTCARCAFSW